MKKDQQIRNLKRILGSKSDVIDLQAHVDGRLSYAENKRIVLGKAKRNSLIKTRKLTFKGSPVYFLDKAETIYAAMNNRTKAQESRKTAKITFNPRLLTYDQFYKWKRNPHRYDIIGVDTKGTYATKKRYKKLSMQEIRKIEEEIL